MAIEGSTKYLVSEVLIAVLLLKFGFHAGESSITKIFFKAFTYDKIVSVSKVFESLTIKSFFKVSLEA